MRQDGWDEEEGDKKETIGKGKKSVHDRMTFAEDKIRGLDIHIEATMTSFNSNFYSHDGTCKRREMICRIQYRIRDNKCFPPYAQMRVPLEVGVYS